MISDSFATFLAYSVELEQESQTRYEEIAESMETHHNALVSQFFLRMAKEAENHLAEVRALSEGAILPKIHAWEFQWPDVEPPETTSYEALHYRMSLREAIELALDNERAAEQFYREYAGRSDDPRVKTSALEFADEEKSHAQALVRMLEDLPEDIDLGRLEDDPPVMPE